MLCILCVSTSDRIIEIFSEEGIRLDACNVISKHFWLKPNAEDPSARMICWSCWSRVDSFHHFFQIIEKAHAKLSTTNILNQNNVSDDDSNFTFGDLLETKYEVKPEPFAYAKDDLALNQNEQIEKSFESHSDVFGQQTCPMLESSNSPVPPANVKIKSEKCKIEIPSEEQNHSVSKILSSILSAKNSTKAARHKKACKNVIEAKKYEKKRVPCQKFDEVIRENMELSCTICQEPLSSFSILKEHYQSEHNENGYVVCCEKKFESRHKLVQHILLHNDPEYFKCDVCGRAFEYKKGLQTHLKSHMNKDQTYDCEKCKKSFYRKEKLERHMKTHMRREQICEQCGKVTQSLRQHQLLSHSDIPRERVQCPKCLAYLADNSTLRRHMKNQHPEKETLHVCNICGKISSSANGLRRHILYMHKAERRHKCPMCEKAFKAPQILRPDAENPNAKVICRSCWTAIESFHRFFQMVEKAHAKLSTTNFSNQDNASDDGNSYTYPELLTAEYNIKPEPIDETKVDLATLENEHDGISFNNASVVQETCPKQKQPATPSPYAKVKIRSEYNVKCKMESMEEEINQPISDSESEIPLSVLSAQCASKTPYSKRFNSADAKNVVKCKKYEKKKVPCQKFDEVIRENMELSCTICQKSLSSFFVLKEHYQSVHNESGYVICCEKKFESRHGLVHHILLHNDPEHFKCDVCGRVLANKKSLMFHKRTHSNKDQTYSCKKCNKIFFRKERLERHMKTHMRREQICEQCGKVTQSLRQHQLRVHSGIPKQPLQCPKCSKFLADSSTLHTHMKYQHPKTETLNVCNICGKISSSGYGLKRHILYMHKAERRHKCPMCEKAFKAPQILRPNAEEPNAKVICRSCWTAVESFHLFFQMIEEAHSKLSATNFYNQDNPSDDENSYTYPELLTAEYDIKQEPIDDTNVDLATHDRLSFGKKSDVFRQKAYSKRKSPGSQSPHLKVKIKSEDNVSCKEESTAEENNQSTSDSESEIPLALLSAQSYLKTLNLRKINPAVSGTSMKKYQKKKIPCQKFDEVIRENMKLSCKICQMPLSSFFVLKEHYQSVHNESGYVICCEKKFESRHGLVHHILLHNDPEHFKCDVCGRVLANKKSLKFHQKTHLKKDKPFSCEKCKRCFSRKEKLENHMKKHVRPEKICEQCGKVTRSLRDHQHREHSDNPKVRVQCPTCHKYLSDNSSLRRHIKYQHPKTEMLNVCNICGKISSSGYGLIRHIFNMHKSERRHKCTLCEKAFKFAHILRVSRLL